MSGRALFGTDGVRGLANAEPMTVETIMRLGVAAGQRFTRGSHRHRVVIGKDTRLSGYMLEPALTAGFVSVGMDVILVGPIPTPGIAMLTRAMRCDLGVMISASHNPFQDNGIKLFGPDGYKLSDAIELEIENLMGGDLDEARIAPNRLGRAKRLEDAGGRYIEYAKTTFPRGLRLDGLKVVVDCANGAAYKVAPTVFWELGADVIRIGVEPNGFNINQDCGSLYPSRLQDLVVSQQAHLGIALDGDADRVLFCDERGEMVDGDQVLALVAKHWQHKAQLKGGAVVATVMSNLGLERHLNSTGLQLVRTNVGDRYVVDEMRQSGCNLGGEQSGHIIMGQHATTGDGTIAALQVLAALVEGGKPASEALRLYEPVPQLLTNVGLKNGKKAEAVLKLEEVKQAITEVERRLGGSGRLVIRKSGTEPLIRIMVEGDDEAQVKALVTDLERIISTSAAEL
ncbi:MAG TPA: phosphoglucosamine mutase [Rhodospirillaceae bacterium]|nr:phosphoglucosamine mutase [Candidatus Neomarinimicrobiota bacterium]HCX15016.1 phosphoglucosamine mutase [Rhodospirillaceae bacterium]